MFIVLLKVCIVHLPSCMPQQSHHLHVPLHDCQMQRCKLPLRQHVDVSIQLNQAFHNCGVSLLSSDVQRLPVLPFPTHWRAVQQQQGSQRATAMLRCKVKWFTIPPILHMQRRTLIKKTTRHSITPFFGCVIQRGVGGIILRIYRRSKLQ